VIMLAGVGNRPWY